MRVEISDVHGSHGLVFTLDIDEVKNKEDREVMNTLTKLLTPMVAGKHKGRSVLYVYEIQISGNSCRLKFAEEYKRYAKVHGLWNHDRKDMNFTVITLNGEKDTDTSDTTRFVCHWCTKEVYGVHRDVTNVYDKKSGKMKTVSVHGDCQKKREVQIASITFNG